MIVLYTDKDLAYILQTLIFQILHSYYGGGGGGVQVLKDYLYMRY